MSDDDRVAELAAAEADARRLAEELKIARDLEASAKREAWVARREARRAWAESVLATVRASMLVEALDEASRRRERLRAQVRAAGANATRAMGWEQ